MAAPPLHDRNIVIALAFVIAAAIGGSGAQATRSSYNNDEIMRYEAGSNPNPNPNPNAASISAYSWDLHYDDRLHLMPVKKLIGRDRRRHSARGLLDSDSGSAFSFVPTNESSSIDALGGLHYTYLSLGTPSLRFLVVIDTGSDLLWVPCDCQQCSPTDWTAYFGSAAQNEAFSVYSPSGSNTSRSVACSDDICASSGVSECSKKAQSGCSYVVNYMASNTSTSGVIVRDLVYMNPDATANDNASAANSSAVTSLVYFGCGQLQTGDLVEGVAPNGLLGLGPNDISIPNTLARNGLLPSASFSICFSSSDSSGRLIFGTQAKPGVKSTPLLSSSIYYVVKSAKVTVGGSSSLAVAQQLIFDTGTSYTTLPSSIVQSIGTIYKQKITLSAYTDTTDTFDYCWRVSSSSDVSSLPSLSITFAGGNVWEIVDPYVYIQDSKGNIKVACLGIMSGSSIGIIGYNFMGGYEFFLDQEFMTFSWAASDCYQLNQSTVGTRQASTTSKAASATSSAPSSPSPYSSLILPPALRMLLCIPTNLLILMHIILLAFALNH